MVLEVVVWPAVEEGGGGTSCILVLHQLVLEKRAYKIIEPQFFIFPNG